MANPFEIVKAHPMATAAAVVVIIGAVLLFSGGDDGGATVAYEGGDQSAAIALQQQAGQQAAQQFAISAQRDVEMAANETAKYLGNLDAMNNAAAIAANLELGKLQTQTNAVSTDLANTLAAKLSGDQIAAQTAQNQAQYLSLAAQMKSQADIAMASINAQVQVAKINKPKQGLFSKIFG